jgi:TolB protein
VYTAAVGGNYDVWAVRRDGTDLRQLTTSPARDGFPSVAPDGRYIAFMSDRSGEFRIWRMEPDGSRQTMLTDGSFDVEPVVAPDSRHVYFIRMDQPGDPLYMVPVDGGQPTLLTAPRSSAPSAPWPDVPAMFMPQELSPDGTQILGSYFDDQGASGRRFVVVPVGGRGTVHKLDIPIQGRQLAWAPDGRAITYVRRAVGSANLWRQPLDGGQTTQLTNYPAASGNIPSHAWSRDGKWLALVRATPQRQLVLLRDVGRHRR